MNRQPDAKWLRAMAREVAQQPVPEIDWDRIEQRTFQGLEQPAEPPRMEHSARNWPRLVGIAAVAAGLALGISWTASKSTSLEHHPEPSLLQSEQLAAPPPHAPSASVDPELVAHATPLTIEHEGWARFRLAADSRVRVLQLDDRVALDLIQGKIEAQVDKHSDDEIFTVRVEGMRVAVRGTVFSVERQGDTMRVGVQRGSVAVGPTAEGATQVWVMTAPSTGAFSIGAKTRLSNEQAVSTPNTLDAPSQAGSTSSRTVPSAQTEAKGSAQSKAGRTRQEPERQDEEALEEPLPEKLTRELAARALDDIASRVETCYRNAVPRDSEGLTIRAQTTIEIRIAPHGHVIFARFDPPLAPSAQTCASDVVQRARFPRAREESVLILPLRF